MHQPWVWQRLCISYGSGSACASAISLAALDSSLACITDLGLFKTNAQQGCAPCSYNGVDCRQLLPAVLLTCKVGGMRDLYEAYSNVTGGQYEAQAHAMLSIAAQGSPYKPDTAYYLHCLTLAG